MKQLICGTLLMLLLGMASSCGNDLNPEEAGNNRSHKVKEKPVMKTIRMQFGGDYVSETEEPLLRAEDGDTFVGINVYRTEKEKDGAQEEKYAYGLFEGKEGISINVLTGYTYRFEASILIERGDKLILNNRNYYDPFRLHDSSSANFDNAWGFDPKNVGEFQYTYLDTDKTQTPYLCQLKSGTAYISVGGANRAMRYPQVKRFYGTLDSFDPSLTQVVEIPMEYKSFGLKFILESIPAGTSVSVRDVSSNSNKYPDTDPEYFLQFPSDMKLSFNSEESKTWEGIYSLNNLSVPTREFKLRFTWDKGNGESEKFDHSFTVTAKKMKVLNLNIDGDVNETKSGNIIFTNMEDDLEEETPEIIDKNFK